jgi:NADPH:quinone reductase-like Zn-dependent oxidoreductase
MHAQMSGCGAAACIDHTCQDVASRARALAGGPVDAIAGLAGGSLAQAACTALRPGGQIAAIATPELDLDLLLMRASPSTACSSGTTVTAPGAGSAARPARAAACHQPRDPARGSG